MVAGISLSRLTRGHGVHNPLNGLIFYLSCEPGQCLVQNDRAVIIECISAILSLYNEEPRWWFAMEDNSILLSLWMFRS